MIDNQKVIDLSTEIPNDFESPASKYEVESEPSVVEELRAAIQVFLDNLKQNPDVDTIKWPNRVKDIKKFEKKLDKIIKGKT